MDARGQAALYIGLPGQPFLSLFIVKPDAGNLGPDAGEIFLHIVKVPFCCLQIVNVINGLHIGCDIRNKGSAAISLILSHVKYPQQLRVGGVNYQDVVQETVA